MANKRPIEVDLKTIIIQLMYHDKKDYVTFTDVKLLLGFIHQALEDSHKLEKYHIPYDVSDFNIRESVRYYNSDLLWVDVTDEKIHLYARLSVNDLAKKYSVDDDLAFIIKQF